MTKDIKYTDTKDSGIPFFISIVSVIISAIAFVLSILSIQN